MKSEKIDKKLLLSILWVFVTVNYMFCDIFTLMYSPELSRILTGEIGKIKITQNFLLFMALFMEISMIMIVLSRVLPQRLNRLVNMFCGLLLTVVQTASLSTGDNTKHYLFFSIIEITATLLIFGLAWKWRIDNRISTDKTEDLIYSGLAAAEVR